MAERTSRGAFCAAPVARGIGSVGVRTQRYVVHIFRLTVSYRLRALRGGAFHSALRMDRHNACSGPARQTNAGDMAFRHVAARLLATSASERSPDPADNSERALFTRT